jgi:predicted RecB family endonuclease
MTKIHLQNKLRPSVSSARLEEAIAEIKAMTEDRGKVIAKKETSKMDQRIESLKARIKVLEKALVALDKDYQWLKAKQ